MSDRAVLKGRPQHAKGVRCQAGTETYAVARNHALSHSLCQDSHRLAVSVQHDGDVCRIIVLGRGFSERQS